MISVVFEGAGFGVIKFLPGVGFPEQCAVSRSQAAIGRSNPHEF